MLIEIYKYKIYKFIFIKINANTLEFMGISKNSQPATLIIQIHLRFLTSGSWNPEGSIYVYLEVNEVLNIFKTNANTLLILPSYYL